MKVTGKSFSLRIQMLSLIINIKGRYLELIYLGMSILVVSMGLFIHFTTVHTLTSEFIIIQIIAGVATGIMYPCPLIALQAGIQTDDSATATATLGFTRQLFCSISVVLGGVVFQNAMQSQSEVLRMQVGPVVASEFTGKAAAANVLLIQGLDVAKKIAVRKAFAASLKEMWILFACTAAAGLICSFFIQRRSLSRDYTIVKIGLPEKTQGIILEDRV